ncbi:uncharacterized protein PAC_03996 [Phialocephala subalpina]|uniref:Prenylcysteine lyase domain-containing protein n=1 Tax=Phialocephala subalpina TaxID=576137 RepID=A0A1L7WMX2_9HELO|nr:uncharacterized protein PAC_03996 [Phialocephala subalpina]
MPSSKSNFQARPPPYSSPPSYTSQPRGVAQERTPLLDPNQALPSHQYQTHSHSPYTQRPPISPFTRPPNPQPYIHHPSSLPRADPQPGSELQAQEYFQYPRWIYRRILRRDTSRTRGHKTCRHILLALLFLTIVAILFRNYVLFLDFNPPGLVLPPEKEEPVRIAVIGAGPAGVSAALRLGELFPTDEDVRVKGGKGKVKGRKVEVVVFEKSVSVGGRMNLDFELGIGEKEGWARKKFSIEDVASSSLFSHTSSLIRRRAETVLGLEFDADTKTNDMEVKGGKQQDVGFYDGNGITTRMTRPYDKMPWLQWGKLVLKFGTSFLAAHSLPANDVRKFSDMVKLVDTETFEGVEDWIKKAGLKESVEKGAREKLKDGGVGDGYRDKVIEAQVRRQLGQGTEEISALALSLALSREELGASRPMNSIKMQDVLEQLLVKSGAEVRLGMTLETMESERVPDRKNKAWNLSFNGGRVSQVFDKVILTSPFRPLEKAYYRHVWQTFILSSTSLNAGYFNISKSDTLPSQILLTPNSNLPVGMEVVNEISYVKDIFGPDIDTSSDFNAESVFKLSRILSEKPISEYTVRELWGGMKMVVTRKIEGAYPLLFPRSEGRGKFKVEGSEGLWTTAVMEEVIAGVDASWAAGENVANLMKQDM